MARRKRKKKSAASNPMPMIIGAVAAVALLAAGYFILTRTGGSANSPRLPAAQFEKNPGSLRGSDFSVTGKVKEKMHHNDTKGTIIEIEVEEDSKLFRFAIRIPTGVDGPNLSTEQSYIFNGTVNSKGRFVVDSYDDK